MIPIKLAVRDAMRGEPLAPGMRVGRHPAIVPRPCDSQLRDNTPHLVASRLTVDVLHDHRTEPGEPC